MVYISLLGLISLSLYGLLLLENSTMTDILFVSLLGSSYSIVWNQKHDFDDYKNSKLYDKYMTQTLVLILSGYVSLNINQPMITY